MTARLDFAHYSVRPEGRSYVSRCKVCTQERTFYRHSRVGMVDLIRAWQRVHRCSPEVIAARTRRQAERILASLAPDDPRIVVERIEELDQPWHGRGVAA